MTHLAEADLARWHREHPEDDRARVVAHLAACDECRRALAAIVRAEAPATPARFASADFVDAGYRARARARSILHFRRFDARGFAVGLALAAGLVLAIAIPWSTREPAGPAPAVRPRGADVQPLSPAGAVRGDVVFDWASGVRASRYRVEVGAGNGTLFSTETARGPLPMPAAWGPKLQPGADYWWTVTALDQNGTAITSSPRQTFSLAGGRP